MVTKAQAKLGITKGKKKDRYTAKKEKASKREAHKRIPLESDAVAPVAPPPAAAEAVVLDDEDLLDNDDDDVVLADVVGPAVAVAVVDPATALTVKYEAMAKELKAHKKALDALLSHCCQNEKTPDLKRHIRAWVFEETGLCVMCMTSAGCNCLHEEHGRV
jgi:hypothetical protein